MLAACASGNDGAPPPVPSVPLALPANPRGGATLDSLRLFTSRVDADTTRMESFRRPLELGAGSTATLTAWRSDSAWQRVRVDAEGAGFRTSDTYWLHGGALVAARLEMVRPDGPAAVEQVWFRGGELYRWTDAQQRPLAPEAQSTITEVEMLRARLRRILAALPAPSDDR